MIRAVLFTFVIACASDSPTGISSADLSCPSDSTLSYTNFGAAFLSDHCLSCHASKQAPSLASQAAVQANKAAVINAAVTSAAMPKDGSLSTEERQLLGEWLTCGAP
jgi:uncharacterized membrane protein